MKKILLTLILFASVGLMAKLQAQCTVSNLSVEVISFNTSTCQVTFRVSFEQEVNSGNKFAYIHLWDSSTTRNPYHTPAANWVGMYANPSAAPDAAALANAIATISIQFNGTAAPSIMNSYLPDPSAPTLYPLSITKTILPNGVTERETIGPITLTLPACSGVVGIKGDIWASQAANGKNVHCATQGLSFSLNNPQITSAVKVCNPRSITFGIKNNGSANLTEHFLIYKDDGDGVFEPFTGLGGDGPAIITGTDTTLAPGGVQSRFQLAYPGSTTPGEQASLWLEVVVPSSGFTTNAFISNTAVGCSPLPVVFSYFIAKRLSASNVSLTWQTATEINNSGFAVERNVNGSWEQIAFVPSQAVGGNSSSLLTYSYSDPNNVKGISQYRIRQIDINGKSSTTDIRAVRGIDQAGKTIVYPNPSFDGKVNVVFEDASAIRDVSLIDMSGRVLKQWNGVSNNNIQIDNLVPGFYSLRVIVRETGAQSVEKIVINKR